MPRACCIGSTISISDSEVRHHRATRRTNASDLRVVSERYNGQQRHSRSLKNNQYYDPTSPYSYKGGCLEDFNIIPAII